MAALLPNLPLVVATFLLAGLVKGTIGLGLPTIAMGLLSLAMPAGEAAALLVVPSLVTNLWQLLTGPSVRELSRRLSGMMLCIILGTVVTSGVMARTNSSWPNLALGVALLVYSVVSLAKLRFSVRPSAEPWMGPLVGLATGLIAGATGVFVIPAVPYLAALDLDRDEMIQALGLSFTVSTIALAVGLAWHNAFPLQAMTASAAAIVPALIGMAIGGALRSRANPDTFRRWFLIGLSVLGLEIVWRALA